MKVGLAEQSVQTRYAPTAMLQASYLTAAAVYKNPSSAAQVTNPVARRFAALLTALRANISAHRKDQDHIAGSTSARLGVRNAVIG